MSAPVPFQTVAVQRDAAALLRTVGRGARGSRDLDREQARWLMTHMLRGELTDTQLGAALLALRMKGETADELLGFLDAVEADLTPFQTDRPLVVIASVNGSRKLANQVPLLSLLLQRQGVATLVIGQEHEDDRLHTAALWSALGLPRARDRAEAQTRLHHRESVYLDLAVLSPGLARLMAQRAVLGVRNAAHTLVKLLVPVSGPALLLSGFTHGEYGPMMQQVLDARARTGLLLHGCEGEAVPHPARRTALIWAHPPASFQPPAELPQDDAIRVPIPAHDTDLEAHCAWTRSVIDQLAPVPSALDRFVELICDVLRALNAHDALSLEESLP